MVPFEYLSLTRREQGPLPTPYRKSRAQAYHLLLSITCIFYQCILMQRYFLRKGSVLDYRALFSSFKRNPMVPFEYLSLTRREQGPLPNPYRKSCAQVYHLLLSITCTFYQCILLQRYFLRKNEKDNVTH